MDRVNRSLLSASTLLAIPAALLMVSLSDGKSPEVQQAVAHGAGQPHAVQQVAGQQTRPGLLQVLAGTRSKGNENHQHQNMNKTQSKGLLDSLFSRSNSSNGPSSGRPAQSLQHGSTNPHARPAESSQPDWSGVPFHAAGTSGQVANSAPLRDPGDPSAAENQTDTRIVRGTPSRTVQASPVSTRRPAPPTIARSQSTPMSVPTPPRDEPQLAPTPENFSSSSNSSSRRSGRRNVDALSTPDSYSQDSVSSRPTVDQSEVADLVPRVPRTAIQGDAAKKATVPNQSSPASNTNTTSKTPSDRSQPAAKTATAAIGLPKPPADNVQEPASATDLPTRPAGVADNTRTATAKTSSAPGYVTPQVPTAVPAAETPSHPYAASTPSSASLGIPAMSASHRAGPPSQAFGPDQIAGLQEARSLPKGPGLSEIEASSEERLPDLSDMTPAKAASSPIGSGVVPNSGVASYRRPSKSVNEIAENSELATDPYGEVTNPINRRMSTNGQTIPSLPDEGNQQSPSAVPVAPIQGYASQGSNELPGDNFSPSVPDGRNQMRETVGGVDVGPSSSMSELPGIRVTTIGPGAIMIRQTSQYEIRVENRGSIDASGVMVRALVPDWAEVRGQNATRGDIDNQVQGSSERLVWTLDQLPAGASETMHVRLTAARSGTYDLDVDWTLLPQKSTAKVQVREPRLDLTIEGPEEVVYGQSQTYKVRVLNPGDGTAPNVVFTLSPNSATPQTQRIGDIPPGKEAQFDVELTAQDLGDLKIHGLASGELELRAEAEKTIRVAAAKIEAVLSGPEVKYQNTEAMYSLQIQNNGSATSERVVATLRLPSGAKYLGGFEDAEQQGSSLRWEIKALAPGANRNYQFRCNMGSTGEHLFAFECKGTAAGSAQVSIATRVESIADLVLTVSDPVAPAPIGTDVTYEIVIRNRGSKEATDVRAIAQFSHGIEPLRLEGHSGEVMTGQVLFDAIPRIAAGQEVRLKVTAQAESAGHHRFRTEVRSGDTVLVAEEATHYMSPKGDRVSRRSSEPSAR